MSQNSLFFYLEASFIARTSGSVFIQVSDQGQTWACSCLPSSSTSSALDQILVGIRVGNMLLLRGQTIRNNSENTRPRYNNFQCWGSSQEKELCEGLCGTCLFLLVRRVGWVEAAVAVGRVGNGRGCCDEGKDAVKGAGSRGGSWRPRSHAWLDAQVPLGV